MPTFPLAVISHPLGGLRPDEVKKKAEGALEEVIYILTQPREKLEKEYGNGR
ncbi:MAG: hypothetical protein HY731_12850 [Candidatus Tectomicrobia bacterium]|nr:hypothetical protein [Candidatus Tectomicrobia bacterium]